MSKMPKLRFKFFLCMMGVLIVAGCNATSGTRDSNWSPRPKAVNGASESKSAKITKHASLEEEGLSPLEQHMRARGMVNPSDTSPTHSYTYTANSPADIRSTKNMVVPPKKPRTSKSIFSKAAKVFTPTAPAASASRASAAVPAVKPAPRSTASIQSSVMAQAPVAARKPSRAPVANQTGRDASGGSSATVRGLRIGQHGEKTRIVLDVSASTPFSYNMDVRKNVLVIQLPNARWGAEAKRVFDAHPLLMAYLAKPNSSGGTFLAIKMKRSAALVFKAKYGASGSNANHRIVFDVTPA